MKQMTPEEAEFFRDMESLFLQPGWTRLVQGWVEELGRMPSIAFFSAKSMDDVLAARVRHETLTELVQLPEHIERLRAEVLDDPTAQAYE
jgi:hypothetical protein